MGKKRGTTQDRIAELEYQVDKLKTVVRSLEKRLARRIVDPRELATTPYGGPVDDDTKPRW